MERQQSEFNMAVSYLNRLNALFYAADEAAITLDVSAWFHTLMSIERELSTEMKKTKELDELNQFKKMRETINSILEKNTIRNNRTGRLEVIPELYDALHDYELALRKVLREAGLQNKIMGDAERALK